MVAAAPDRCEVGASPAYDDRGPADSKSLPTISFRILAVALTPSAGIDVWSSKRGCDWTSSSMDARISPRDCYICADEFV